MNPSFLTHELLSLSPTWSSLSARIGQAKTMREVVRLLDERDTHIKSHLRTVARSLPDYRRVEHAAETQGRRLIETGLAKLRATPVDELEAASALFTLEFRDQCRGTFPSLYYLADRGLQEVLSASRRRDRDRPPG